MWTHEEVKRNNCTILIINKDGRTRGSLELNDEGEVIQWIEVLRILNMKK